MRNKRDLVRALSLSSLLLFSLAPRSAQAHRFADETAVLWHPYAEWSVLNASYSGNPYDLGAYAVFTHESGAPVRRTPMFYAGADTWSFRFAGTELGAWNFTTESADPELDGHTGVVRVGPNPDADARGFITHVGNMWARRVGNAGAVEPFMNITLNNVTGGPGSWTNTRIDEFLRVSVGDGLTGIRLSMHNGWVDPAFPGNGSWRATSNRDPSPESFDALERLIERTRSAGGITHIWYNGDCMRSQCVQRGFGDNGARTDGERRLLRYIAARLGPISSWMMGYGYDVPEDADTSDLRGWGNYLHSQLGWDHYLGARAGACRSCFRVPYDLWPEADFYSREGTQYTYDRMTQVMDVDLTRPHALDERWGFDSRLMWAMAMAGGVSAIRRGTGAPANATTHKAFWSGRLLADMRRDNSLTDGWALVTSGRDNAVFYREDSTSIRLDLSGMPSALAAVAVDTRAPYSERDLGALANTDQTITLPSRSDWAIAVGDFSTRLCADGTAPPCLVAECDTDGDCEDGNECTVDRCGAGSCGNTPIAGCGGADGGGLDAGVRPGFDGGAGTDADAGTDAGDGGAGATGGSGCGCTVVPGGGPTLGFLFLLALGFVVRRRRCQPRHQGT